MKKLITVICLISISMIVNAQGDTKAKAILDKASAKVKALKAMKANFSLTIKGARDNKSQTKIGSVQMKGTKYHVSISGQEIFCDNKTSWTYMKESNEVQINNFDANESSFSPSKLFTNFYDKEYSYKYVGTSNVKGKKVDVIHLTPTTKFAKYSKVELMVDQTNSMIAGGKIFEKNGNTYAYSITGYEANPNLPDNTFIFNPKKYANLEVIDLR